MNIHNYFTHKFGPDRARYLLWLYLTAPVAQNLSGYTLLNVSRVHRDGTADGSVIQFVNGRTWLEAVLLAIETHGVNSCRTQVALVRMGAERVMDVVYDRQVLYMTPDQVVRSVADMRRWGDYHLRRAYELMHLPWKRVEATHPDVLLREARKAAMLGVHYASTPNVPASPALPGDVPA